MAERNLSNLGILFFFLLLVVSEGRGSIIYHPQQIQENEKIRDLYFPFDYYFNTAFDVNQNPYYFNQKHYWSNHQVVWRRIKNPDRSIRQDGGYQKMFKDEFFSSRVVPNIALHTLGGGYDFLHLQEWYAHHGFPIPTFFSIVTSYAAHIGNEAFEASDPHLVSHDHIVDLFFFDVMGKILFSNTEVASFFYHDMGMRNWTFIPMYNPNHSMVWNSGTNYIFRPSFLTYQNKLVPFVLAGMQVLFGLSLNLYDKKFLTISAGPAMTDPLRGKSKLALGFFYDDDGRPESSFLINSTEEFRYRLNLFPSFFKFKNYSIGAILGIDRGDNPVGGLNVNMPIGIGATYL